MLALSAPQTTAPGGGGGKPGGVAVTPGCQPIAYSARLSHVLTGPQAPPSPFGGGSSLPVGGGTSSPVGGGSLSPVAGGLPSSVGGDGSGGWLLGGATHTASAS